MTHQDDAREAAAVVLAEISSMIPTELQPMIRTALAIAWLEGSKVGATEAAEIFRKALVA